MTFTTLGKNEMLDALAGQLTHAGLFEAGTPIAVTGEADNETFTAAAHGLANGMVVVLSDLAGGEGTGLVNGRVYFVRETAANTFKLALVPGGGAGDQAAVAFSTDVVAATATPYTELSGGVPAYARLAIAFGAAAGGTIDDSTNGAQFDVAADTGVDAVGGFTALANGTLLDFVELGADAEHFTNQGTFELTNYLLDLLTGA